MSMRKLSQHKLASTQRGAIMIVTMVAFIIVWVIVSQSIENTTLSEKMAANGQKKRITIEAAQSAIDMAFNEIVDGDYSMLGKALKSKDRVSNTEQLDLIDNKVPKEDRKQITSEVFARYVSDVLLTSSSSLNADETVPTIKGKRYELEARGTLRSGNTIVTTIRQGVEIR